MALSKLGKKTEKGNTQGPFLKVKTTDADLIFIMEFLDKYHNKKKVLGCKTFFTCSNITYSNSNTIFNSITTCLL